MTRFRLGGEGFATAIAGFNGPEGFLETILDNDINYSKYSVYRVVIDSGLLRIWFIDKACSGMDEDQYELYSLSVEANTNIYFAIEDYEADGGTDNCNDSLVRAIRRWPIYASAGVLFSGAQVCRQANLSP